MSREFKHQSMQDRESILRYLEAITSGLREGRIVFTSGQDEILLRPEGLLTLTVKAKRKEDVSKLTLSVSWNDGAPKSDQPPLIVRLTAPDETQ
jgi:amphi-Trp domain-containing protein